MIPLPGTPAGEAVAGAVRQNNCAVILALHCDPSCTSSSSSTYSYHTRYSRSIKMPCKGTQAYVAQTSTSWAKAHPRCMHASTQQQQQQQRNSTTSAEQTRDMPQHNKQALRRFFALKKKLSRKFTQEHLEPRYTRFLGTATAVISGTTLSIQV